MRRADNERRIFEEHETPRDLRDRPFRYKNNAQVLADVAITGMMRYYMLAGLPVPLHAGMRVMMDTGAPWCMGKGDDE
jgi:hypothetical protein